MAITRSWERGQGTERQAGSLSYAETADSKLEFEAQWQWSIMYEYATSSPKEMLHHLLRGIQVTQLSGKPDTR